MTTETVHDWMSTSQVMKMLGLSKPIVLKLCEEGKFADAYRPTKASRWRIPRASVIAFHESVKSKPVRR